jgi:hypothetical protein
MDKRKQGEKITHKKARGAEFSLTTNQSVGIFKLGFTVLECLKPYDYIYHERLEEYEESCDYYEISSIGLSLYLDDNKLLSDVICDKYCFFENINLIGMNVNNFMEQFGVTADKVEKLSVSLNESKIQNQTVYDFDKMGLIIWTFRKKIVRITCYKNEEAR